MLQDRVQQVRAKIAELTRLYETRTGKTLPFVDIRFDLRGACAGQAGRRADRHGYKYIMRFNRDMMQNQGWDHLFNDTVPHELAHIICFVENTDRGHGAAWQRVCRMLGGSGERCHKEAVVYARGRTYVYTTSTGYTYNFSETKHRKIQQGAYYTFRDRKMGRVDRTCAFNLLGAQPIVSYDAPKITVENKRELPVAAPRKLSNAAQVREWIRARREAGLGDEQIRVEVQELAQRELGQTAAMAKQYLRTEWNK